MLTVNMIPILNDNYAFIIQSGQHTAIIDPGEADPIIEYLESNNLKPDYIINTHHHADHVDGNQKIAQKYNAKIIAPKKEKEKIGPVDIELSDGEIFDFGDTQFKAIETPGHTQGHLCLSFDKDNILFAGDMVFAMGCGRPFEGTAKDLYESFGKLSHLSDDTIIYCGHEYTQTNANFSLSITPNDQALQERSNQVNELRENNKPTIPTTMKIERATNLFMRAKTLEEFEDLRERRNNF